MTFSLAQLYFGVVGYLGLLFLVAYAAEQHWLPRSWIRHPTVFVLSLGVYATSWSFYGSVGYAEENGYLFLTIYIGLTLAFLLSPILLRPLFRIVRDYQLTSIADLFAFRYRSQGAGILVALFMLAGTLPYLALQIRAVTESVQILTEEVAPTNLALGFCFTLILFSILFGARHISPREKHTGLVAAIAFESLVKLVAMLAVGGFAVFGVFGGFGELEKWLSIHPEALEALYRPAREGPWFTLLFLSFCAAFLLPRQFHMLFAENSQGRNLLFAGWAFPLFLLIFNLSIPPILWAAQQSGVTTSPDYYVLGLTLNSGTSWLPLLAFLGGVSSASAMMIVTTLALSSMALNHLILPASYPDPTWNLYRMLAWGRRILIAIIILAGFGFYVSLENRENLVQLGLISFVAVTQFLPGVIGSLYWPRANRWGLLAGLGAGAIVWFGTLIVPLLQTAGLLQFESEFQSLYPDHGMDRWSYVTFLSLTINVSVFALVSLLTRQSVEEAEAAQSCVRETLSLPRGLLMVRSTDEFTQRLARVLGHEMASKEVSRALEEMMISVDETHPRILVRVRDRIERNLSGMIGPQLARMVVHQQLTVDPKSQTAFADSMRLIEERLESSRTRLRGLAAQLDTLRRYQQALLEQLPLGACVLGPQGDVVLWNKSMGLLSAISSSQAIGRRVVNLPSPWGPLIDEFSGDQSLHRYKLHMLTDGQTRWFNLHKAIVDTPVDMARREGVDDSDRLGMVILVEDVSESHILEAGLAHSERLASIGRLAAGVAHEIGNPVTGIASLAQNMKAETKESGVKKTALLIDEQIKRISEIVQTLVDFSRSGNSEGKEEVFDLGEAINDAIRLVALSHEGRQVECKNHCSEGLLIRGDRQRIAQVFVNVLTNACHASDVGDHIDVRESREGDQVVVRVVDQGEGIPNDLLEHIFEPFVTSKQVGKGTGLGLALAYNTISEHGGTINVESKLGSGTEVIIRLHLDQELML